MGFFASEMAAARARDAEVLRLGLSKVPLNFPEEGGRGEAPGAEFADLVSLSAAADAALTLEKRRVRRKERKRQRTESSAAAPLPAGESS